MKRKVFYLLPLLILACAPVSETSQTQQRLNELEIRVARLEERQEDINQKLEEMNKRLDLLTEEVGRIKLSRVSREGYRKKPGVGKPTAPEVGEEERLAYEEALTLFREGKYIEARDAFLNFLKTFKPNKYTDNAYFWLGKVYYELGNTTRAKQIFDTLIKKCEEGKLPDCNKLPDTYFMLVKLSLDEGDIASANKYFSTLEEKFPNSEATSRARALLYKEP